MNPRCVCLFSLLAAACLSSSFAAETWWKPYDPKAPGTLFHASWNDMGPGYQSSDDTESMVTGPHQAYVPESVNEAFGQCVRIGQPTGASLGDPSCLKYPAEGKMSPVKGTIEFWFKPSVILADNKNMISFFKCGNFWLRGDPHEPGSRWMALEVGGESRRFHLKFPPDFFEGEWGWHHLALTYDFSDPTLGMVEFFIDGISIGRTDKLDASGLKLGETIVLGNNGEDNYLTNGFYDEFRISDVVREFGDRP
ncbi:MAG: LamG domain-containing protein [Verrucomicrobiae bacterium]